MVTTFCYVGCLDRRKQISSKFVKKKKDDNAWLVYVLLFFGELKKIEELKKNWRTKKKLISITVQFYTKLLRQILLKKWQHMLQFL